MTPEFSRLLRVDRVPPAGLEETIEATPEERSALAERFGLPAIHRLRATFNALPWRRGSIELQGTVDAEVEQTCVVTLEEFKTAIEEPIRRYYLGAAAPGRHTAVLSIESLEEDEPETIAGGAIDLGEVAAEALALALDPYPKKPGAVFAPAAELAADTAEHPFHALERLKKR